MTHMSLGLELAPWITALQAAEPGDTTLLVTLLRSGELFALPADRQHEVVFHIADLLQRHTLVRKPGNQATPSYELTEPEITRLHAYNRMKLLMIQGESVKAAAKHAAQDFPGVTVAALLLMHENKLGAEEDRKRRWFNG
jgi:hypothetical protein